MLDMTVTGLLVITHTPVDHHLILLFLHKRISARHQRPNHPSSLASISLVTDLKTMLAEEAKLSTPVLIQPFQLSHSV